MSRTPINPDFLLEPPDEFFDWHLPAKELECGEDRTAVFDAEFFKKKRPEIWLTHGTARVRVYQQVKDGLIWERYEGILW